MSINEYFKYDTEAASLCGYKVEARNEPLTKKQLKGLKHAGGYAKAHTPIITGTGIPYQGRSFTPR